MNKQYKGISDLLLDGGYNVVKNLKNNGQKKNLNRFKVENKF